MRIEDLEWFLENGNELGFRKETESPNHFGWILIRKEKVHDRYLSLLEPGEELIFVQQQKEIEEKPYLVSIIELERTKYEDEFFQEDYDLHEIYRFSELEKIQSFLNKFGKKLEDIKWRIEIDAP